MKYKWIKKEDEILGITIYYIEGYGYGSSIMARIFAEIVPEYYGSSRKVTRYFPQIDDEDKEYRIIVGDEDKGFSRLSFAKKALIEAFEKYMEQRSE